MLVNTLKSISNNNISAPDKGLDLHTRRKLTTPLLSLRARQPLPDDGDQAQNGTVICNIIGLCSIYVCQKKRTRTEEVKINNCNDFQNKMDITVMA